MRPRENARNAEHDFPHLTPALSPPSDGAEREKPLRALRSFAAIASVCIRVHLWLKMSRLLTPALASFEEEREKEFMPDVFTKKKRSEVTARIRGRGRC